MCFSRPVPRYIYYFSLGHTREGKIIYHARNIHVYTVYALRRPTSYAVQSPFKIKRANLLSSMSSSPKDVHTMIRYSANTEM